MPCVSELGVGISHDYRSGCRMVTLCVARTLCVIVYDFVRAPAGH